MPRAVPGLLCGRRPTSWFRDGQPGTSASFYKVSDRSELAASAARERIRWKGGAAMAIKIKRAYEDPGPEDGYRVLVDRLWPRGIRKDALHVDLWAKDLSPSTELRQWFQHDPARWEEFQRRYREELHAGPAAALLADLDRRSRTETVTLVFGARDARHSNAEALVEMLQAGPAPSVPGSEGNG